MTDTRPAWDPKQYDLFEAERFRAVRELLRRLPADFEPDEIWDLGCGGGRDAAGLKRWRPEARVHGLDSSEAMLAQAQARRDEVDWRLGGIADWTPERPVDLILANASLQWLPDHDTLLRRLAGTLAPGGVLAVQMPIAHETRHHVIMRQVADEGPWAKALAGVHRIAPLLSAEAYYAVLSETCESIDIWTTTYLQVLRQPNAVLEWMKGTALRPYLAALEDPIMRQAYLDALGARLSEAFPRRADGVTLMPFPRLFLVARRR